MKRLSLDGPDGPARVPLGTRPMRPSASHARSAFTLIELLAVVLLMGLLIALAASRLDNVFPRTRLRAAARELAGVIHTARDQAILTSRNCGLRFDLSAGEYWIVVSSDDPGSQASLRFSGGRFEEFGREALTKHHLPRGVSFAELRAGTSIALVTGVVATEIGHTGAFSSLLIQLKNETGDKYTLKVNGLTGQPEFFEGDSYQEFAQNVEPVRIY